MLTLAVLGLAWCARSRHAAASPGPCPPSVRVTGDAALVEPIRATLAARGLGGQETEACPGLRAHVERRDELLLVEVIDAYGRRSRREVSDSGTAVALIESWARPEVVAGDPLGDLPGAGDIAPAPATTRRTAPAPAIVPAASGIAITAGMVRDGDAGGWFDVAMTGCWSLGPVCVGTRLAVARDARLGEMSFHPRTTGGVAVYAERPLRTGRVAIVPGAAVGAAWNRASALGPHRDQTLDTYDLRALGVLAVRYAVTARWSLEASLVGEAAVGAHATMPSSYVHALAGVRLGAP